MFASQLQTVTSYTLLLQHHRNISGINQRAVWLHFHFDAHRLRQTHCLLCASATFSHSSSYVHMWCKSCCNCRLLRYNFRRHIRADVCSYPCAINCCAPASATLQAHEHDLSSLGTSKLPCFHHSTGWSTRVPWAGVFIQQFSDVEDEQFMKSFDNRRWRTTKKSALKGNGEGDARLLLVRNLRDIIHGNVTFCSIYVYHVPFTFLSYFFCLLRWRFSSRSSFSSSIASSLPHTSKARSLTLKCIHVPAQSCTCKYAEFYLSYTRM